jgi:hypothetical protein
MHEDVITTADPTHITPASATDYMLVLECVEGSGPTFT